MKRGFTLVELLAVIALIAVIAIIGVAGITKVKNNINDDLWNSTINLVESGAVHYGEDYKNQLTSSCLVDGITRQNCKMISVQELITQGYINAKDDKIVDSRKDKEDADYFINNKIVNIYIDDDIVYANLSNTNLSSKCSIDNYIIINNKLYCQVSFNSRNISYPNIYYAESNNNLIKAKICPNMYNYGICYVSKPINYNSPSCSGYVINVNDIGGRVIFDCCNYDYINGECMQMVEPIDKTINCGGPVLDYYYTNYNINYKCCPAGSKAINNMCVIEI